METCQCMLVKGPCYLYVFVMNTTLLFNFFFTLAITIGLWRSMLQISTVDKL